VLEYRQENGGIIVTIEEYIKLSKKMPNTSDGGSICYHFPNVALVKYTIPKKYGLARPSEESIRINVNQKRKEGVRTPAHLAIKRETELNPKTGEETEVCWVLQELAPGKNFNYYCHGETITDKINLQEVIANAPFSHFQKLVKDVMELLYFGIEIKPQNVYYDDNKKTGGFTIIDLLKDGSENKFNSESMADIRFLKDCCTNLIERCGIGYFDKATIPEREKSQELRYQMRACIFQALESTIPNFSNKRRWLLRSYSKDTLNYFSTHGLIVGNLSLTESEVNEFASQLRHIADTCIEKIASGEYRYWQIMCNEIRISLSQNLLNDAWLYHPSNNRQESSYTSEYAEFDWQSDCKKDLENMAKRIFIKRFKDRIEDEKNKLNPNEHLLVAFQELEESTRKLNTLSKVGV